LFGGIISYMLILMCLQGAMSPAIDLTAGEKERGTMETILSSPVSRTHLVLGKFLLVLTAALVTTLLLLVSVSISSSAVQHSHLLDQCRRRPAASVFQPGSEDDRIRGDRTIPLSVLFASGLMTIALLPRATKRRRATSRR
jgi:sodium transport system permease protein